MEKTYTIKEVLKIMKPIEREFYSTVRKLLRDIEQGLRDLESSHNPKGNKNE